MDFMRNLTGMEVIIDPAMIDGFEQKRRHKKKRINKKWMKRYGTKPIYDMRHAYIIGNRIVMSKGMFELLKKEATNDTRDQDQEDIHRTNTHRTEELRDQEE